MQILTNKTEIIDTLPGESDNLALHVQLCEQRYIQLITKFDHVDNRLEKIESVLVDIKSKIEDKEKAHYTYYMKWAGVIIGLLATFSLGLVSHLLLK